MACPYEDDEGISIRSGGSEAHGISFPTTGAHMGWPTRRGRLSDRLSLGREGNEGEMIENSGKKARMSMKTKGRSEEPTDWGTSRGCLADAYFPEIQQGQSNYGSKAAASLPHSKTRGTKPECL